MRFLLANRGSIDGPRERARNHIRPNTSGGDGHSHGLRQIARSGIGGRVLRCYQLRSRNSACARAMMPGYRLSGYQGMSAILLKPGIVSMCRTMRARISRSGRGPRKAAMFSAAWAGLDVEGRAQVTFGWEMTHL